MKVGNFELTVAGKKEESTGHVALEQGEQYTVVLENYYLDRRASASVKIDGEEIESFRLDKGGVLKLERKPGSDKGRFTFYAVDSKEGKMVGGEAGVSTNGLIEVTFTPEKYQDNVRSYSMNRDRPAEPQPRSLNWSNDPDALYSRRMTKGSGQSMGGSQYYNDTPVYGGVYNDASSLGLVGSIQCSATNAVSPQSATRGLSEGVTGLSGHSKQNFVSVAALDLDTERAVTISLRLGVINNDPRPLKTKNANPVPAPLG